MKDPGAVNLTSELAAARAEQVSCLARGDHETAVLLTAWIDVLLDEWNRRQDQHSRTEPPDQSDRAV